MDWSWCHTSKGERTPDKPFATGALHGLRLANSRPDCLARAAVEGMLCGLADGLDALVAQGVEVERIILVGGASRSKSVRQIAPQVLGRTVEVAGSGEHVADDAARQAAWVLSGEPSAPSWDIRERCTYEAESTPWVRERYAEVSDLTATAPTGLENPATLLR